MISSGSDHSAELLHVAILENFVPENAVPDKHLYNTVELIVTLVYSCSEFATVGGVEQAIAEDITVYYKLNDVIRNISDVLSTVQANVLHSCRPFPTILFR